MTRFLVPPLLSLRVRSIIFLLTALGLALPLRAAPAAAAGGERTAWFREARYGMFIHWGLYSVPAGSYRGKPIDRETGGGNGLGEWIMFNAKIPVAEYAAYAKEFNPVKFDADAWVRLAKEAGMKYIVITSKHHEGFAMFHSAVSSFNIYDATPFKRDPLKELAEACARHGLRLGFYYSQAQDWHHPGGAARSGKGPMAGGDPERGHWDKAQDGDFDRYLDEIAAPQVRELLTHYGPLSIFWWDTPVGMTPERAARLASLLKLQPQIITNNRLLNPRVPNAFSGDTETPEQHVPATGLGERLFEVCMTMNDTWGYKAHDQHWKSAADITRKLIDIASKGGNFLLNVGPTSEGVIPQPSVERLRETGRWLRVNGEAIYGTTASRFRRLPWGRSTTKGNTIFLHVFDWPGDGTLMLPGLKTPVRRATLLATGQTLVAEIAADGVRLQLPGEAPDAVASVIKLEFDRTPGIEQSLPTTNEAGVLVLPASLAAIVNAYASNAQLVGTGADACVEGWTQANTTLNWEFAVARAGSYTLEIDVAGGGGGELAIACGATKLSAPAPAKATEFHWASLGEITLDHAGEQAVELKSQGDDWQDVRLRAVRLTETTR